MFLGVARVRVRSVSEGLRPPKVEALEALAEDSIESIAAEASYSQGNNQKAHSFRRLAKMCLGM